MSTAFLAWTSSDHHFHEKSGKEEIPRCRDTLSGWAIYVCTIALRVAVLGILGAYLQARVLVLIAFLVLTNLFLAARILKTDMAKNVWTSVASVLVPVCFVSRDTITVYKQNPHVGHSPGGRFYTYYLWNCRVFFVFTLLAMGALHALLEFAPVEYTCKNLPVLSCSDACPARRCSSIEGFDHAWLLSYGWGIVAALNVTAMALMYLHGCLCGHFTDHGVTEVDRV